MGKYDPWGDKEKQIQFSTPKGTSAQRKALGARRKPAPKKQGSGKLGSMSEMREMPKIMGSTKAQRAASARDLMDNMRSRNLLRTRKKSGK